MICRFLNSVVFVIVIGLLCTNALQASMHDQEIETYNVRYRLAQYIGEQIPNEYWWVTNRIGFKELNCMMSNCYTHQKKVLFNFVGSLWAIESDVESRIKNVRVIFKSHESPPVTLVQFDFDSQLPYTIQLSAYDFNGHIQHCFLFSICLANRYMDQHVPIEEYKTFCKQFFDLVYEKGIPDEQVERNKSVIKAGYTLFGSSNS